MNKTVMKSILAIALIFLSGVSANAQSSVEKQMADRAAQKVALFGEYIKDIARKHDERGKSVGLQERLYYCGKALKLFIGEGDSYFENGEERAGVAMETTSVNRAGTNRRLMKNYLNGLANLRYTEVSIETTDVANIKVSDLQQISENTFVCTCSIYQTFVGYRDGRPVYKDITKKNIKCYIIREEIVKDDGDRGYEFIVLLGDVTASETKRA